MPISDEGFTQDYELGVEQELWLYCRLCRQRFNVCFKPKTSSVRLQCVCGQENPLSSMDVFRSEQASKEHAEFYERVYRTAKSALRDAGFPVPPSGKWRNVHDIEEDSQFESYFNAQEDESAIAEGYWEDERDDETSPEAIEVRLAEFDAQLYEVEGVLERHDLLSELIEWSYVRRHLSEVAYQRFLDACQRDIELAREVAQEARRRMKGGHKVRLSFTSFKHYLIDLGERDELEEALEVAERAHGLGLKGYAKKVAALRAQLGIR